MLFCFDRTAVAAQFADETGNSSHLDIVPDFQKLSILPSYIFQLGYHELPKVRGTFYEAQIHLLGAVSFEKKVTLYCHQNGIVLFFTY